MHFLQSSFSKANNIDMDIFPVIFNDKIVKLKDINRQKSIDNIKNMIRDEKLPVEDLIAYTKGIKFIRVNIIIYKSSIILLNIGGLTFNKSNRRVYSQRQYSCHQYYQ